MKRYFHPCHDVNENDILVNKTARVSRIMPRLTTVTETGSPAASDAPENRAYNQQGILCNQIK